MVDVPTTITCEGEHRSLTLMSVDHMPVTHIGAAIAGKDSYACTATATRIFGPPAAIHFRGPGFYSTDVKSRVERKRRKMVADDMPRGDSDSHDLARRW